MELSISWDGNIRLSSENIPRLLQKPTILCSQGLTSGPCAVQTECSPCLPTLILDQF
jgi:hypothetical protein